MGIDQKPPHRTQWETTVRPWGPKNLRQEVRCSTQTWTPKRGLLTQEIWCSHPTGSTCPLAPLGSQSWLVSDQRINQPFVGHWCHLFDPGFLNPPEVELEISSDSHRTQRLGNFKDDQRSWWPGELQILWYPAQFSNFFRAHSNHPNLSSLAQAHSKSGYLNVRSTQAVAGGTW